MVFEGRMNANRAVTVFFFLLLQLAVVRGVAAQPLSARPLVDVPFATTQPFVAISASFAEDENWSYLGTPGGLYRLPGMVQVDSEAELIEFAGRAIHAVYVHEGNLYVLKERLESKDEPASDHSFLRSSDGGETFVPLDDGLEECYGGYCAFLSASQAQFQGDTIFLNAGGNLLASRGGEPWVPLIGEIAQMACYDPAFTVRGNRVLVGGECPLDDAYLRHGMLRDGFLEWETSPTDAVTPELENRNVQFIRFIDEGSVVLAGIEGAILRSSDQGASWQFVLFHDIEDANLYPYVTHLLELPDEGRLLAGGFDKANLRPYLAWSRDEGRTWTDLSLAVTADEAFDVLVFLHVDGQGRILAGLLDVDASVIRIVELKESPRRRPVRR
jgi:hypothetical protein